MTTSLISNLQKKRAAFLLGALLSIASASAQTNYVWDADGTGGGMGGTGTWNTPTPALWRVGSNVGALGAWPNTTPSSAIAVFEGTAGTVTVANGATINANGLNFSTPAGVPFWKLESGDSVSNVVLSGSSNAIVLGGRLSSQFTAAFNTKLKLSNGTTAVSGVAGETRLGIGVNPDTANAIGNLTVAAGGTANFFSSGTRAKLFAVGQQYGAFAGGVSSVQGTADFRGGKVSLYSNLLQIGVVVQTNGMTTNTGNVVGTMYQGSDVTSALVIDDQVLVGNITLTGTSEHAGNATGELTLGGNNTFSSAQASEPVVYVGRFVQTTGATNAGHSASASGTLTISGGTTTLTSTGEVSPGVPNTNVLALAIRSSGLDASSTASGTLNLTGGTLNIAGGEIYGGTGTSTVNLNGGTLNMNGRSIGRSGGLITTLNFQSGALQNVFRINDTAGLNKTSAGTLTLSGFNRYTGDTTISEGTLSASNIVVSGGYSDLGNSTTAVGLGAASTKGTLSYTGNTAIYTRGFTIGNGGGQLDVTTSGQSLTVGTGAITGTSGLLTVGGAGNTTITSAITTTTGGLTKTGAGTLTLSNSGNTFTGLTTVTQGTLAYGIADALSSGAVTVNGGTLALGTFSDTVGAVTLTSGSITGSTGVLTGTSYVVESGSISAILAGGGALTKSTGGTVTLSGVNTYTGGTTVSNGTLALSGANRLLSTGAVAVTGGTLDLGAAAQQVGAVTMSSGTISNGTLTGTSYSATNTGTVSAVLAGGSGVTFTKTGAGAVTFSAVNTYLGDTIVSQGTLILSGSGTVASNVIQVQQGAFLTANSGLQLQSGQTLENKGTFTGNLTALSGSTYAPGNSPGIATQVGDLTFNTGSTFEWELIANTDAVAGTNFDQTVFTSGGLNIQTGVTANLVFNAGSTVNWANAFWGSDQQWLVFSGADSLTNVAGIFTNIMVGADAFTQSLASVRSGASFSFTNVGDDVYLTYSIPEPSTTLLLTGGLMAVLFLRRRARI